MKRIRRIGIPRTDMKRLIKKSDISRKDMVDIIKENNPANNEYSTWIRNEYDIMDADYAFGDGFEEIYPDFTKSMAQQALETGEVMVYSSKPFSLGSFVTVSKRYAEDYSGNGPVYQGKMKIDDIAWIDEGEGQIINI